MRRAPRNKGFSAAATLFIGVVIVWAQSRWFEHSAIVFTPSRGLEIIVSNGWVNAVTWARGSTETPARGFWWHSRRVDAVGFSVVTPLKTHDWLNVRWNFCGLAHLAPVDNPRQAHYFIVPMWILAVLPTPLLVAGVARRRRRRHRIRAGLCTCCGYDLTANASGVCPECGGPASAPAPSAPPPA